MFPMSHEPNDADESVPACGLLPQTRSRFSRDGRRLHASVRGPESLTAAALIVDRLCNNAPHLLNAKDQAPS
jgi:hypothetical protein